MTEVAFLEAVSGRHCSVLGIQVASGRGILADDDRPGADPVAVISHGWWRTREIGIRMAVGVERRDINRLVVCRGVIPVVLGLVAGWLRRSRSRPWSRAFSTAGA